MSRRPQNPAELAGAIRDAANRCVTEMELQIAVEKLLDPLLQSLPTRTRLYGRATALGGIPDALHGNLIIEYERPGKLRTKPGLNECIRQLKQYMVEHVTRGSKDDAAALRRTVGVGLDGSRILFVRYRGNRPISIVEKDAKGQLSFFPEDQADFQVTGPEQVSEETVELFLGYLQSLARHPLTPEALASTFGPKGESAQRVVPVLYDKVLRGDSPRVRTFFDEWQRIFGIVYGQDVTKAEEEARALARQFGITTVPKLKEFLFAVHTYFALLMKMLAAELMSMQRGSMLASFIQALIQKDSDEFRDALQDLEEGGLFSRQEITNFLEGDFFSWYVGVWDRKLAHELRFMAKELGGFDPNTPYIAPEHSRDLLKKLYQYLVPKKLRHDLGEYYTPDWLAEHVLNEVGFQGNPDTRLLDPACGSGSFLVVAIKRVKQWGEEQDPPIQPRTLAKKILANLCGFDLNPIAVIAARTNFLLALGELVRHVRPIELPVYICDSLLTPAKHRAQNRFPELSRGYELKTRVGTFVIPREIVDRGRMDGFAAILESCVRKEGGYTEKEFIRRVKSEIGFRDRESEQLLQELHKQLLDLEHSDRNRIWARFIKNSFAPVFKSRKRFDVVAGNPPWVNWENLAAEYRQETSELWRDYGFFTQRGYRAVVPAGKLDLAALFAFAAADTYLTPTGRLGFVITQTLFKSHGAGEGFRRFVLPGAVALGVGKTDDMVQLKPFEGAQNRTAVLTLQKSSATSYPIEYIVWLPTPDYLALRKKTGFEPALGDVVATTERVTLAATPIDPRRTDSAWLTVPQPVLPVCRKALGAAAYRAREGVNTLGANAVYWLRHDDLADGQPLFQNIIEGSRKGVQAVPLTLLDPELIFPLLRGQDVSRWYARPSAHILMPYDLAEPKKPIDEDRLRVDFVRTYEYLRQFRKLLQARIRIKKMGLRWYALGEVGPYTFSSYKLVWREQASEFTAAVVSAVSTDEDNRMAIPDHKLMLVDCSGGELEAHYLCGVMNSAVVRLIIKGYALETSTSVHVLENIAVPQFDRTNELHTDLARLSIEAHRLSANIHEHIDERTAQQQLAGLEEDLDRAAALLWSISSAEMTSVHDALNLFDKIRAAAERKQPQAVASAAVQERLIRQ